jgi:hypothetical protein
MIAAGSGDDPTVSQVSPRVVFVVTVRDNADLLDACLASVAAQNYHDVACVIVDDASKDASPAVAAWWAGEWADRFTATNEVRRRGKLANFADAIAGLNPHDVVVELDGDDRLLGTDAAADLARLHMRLDLVWTQHRIARHRWAGFPHFRSTDLPPAYRDRVDLPRMRWTRTWHPSHLRSFKAWAFHQIDRDDLLVDGEWIRASPDFAYFTPLVEMTPPALRYFYDRELAVYNITEANERFRDGLSAPAFHQAYVVDQIARRPPYRTRPAPLWVGTLDPGSSDVIERISRDLLAGDPATRVLLAAPHPIRASWHPRVQVIGDYTIVPPGTPPTGRIAAALDWLCRYGAELGYRRCVPEQPLLGRSLLRLRDPCEGLPVDTAPQGQQPVS